MNAEEKERKIGKLEEEIKNIWFSLGIGSGFFLLFWWCLEPMMKQIINLDGDGSEILTTISTVFFDYITVAIYWIGYIAGLIAIFKKKRAIKRYKKEKDVPTKINIQKDDVNQNLVYVIDHSEDKPNQYEKGDRDMMKRLFNQNNNVSTNSGKQNASKTRSERHSVRAYNGSTRSSSNTESNNTALDIALASSMYSSNNDNDCSPSSNSSSDYSSGGSGFDGGSSCD